MIFRPAIVLFLALIFILGFAKGRYLLVEVESEKPDPNIHECNTRGSPPDCGRCPRGHHFSCVPHPFIGYCGTCQVLEVHKKKECAVDKDCEYGLDVCIKGLCKVPTSHPPVKKFKKHEGESCGLPFGPMGHDCGECDDGLRCGLGRSPAPASCGLCYKSYKVTRAPWASRTSCRSARDCGTRRQCCSGVCKVLC